METPLNFLQSFLLSEFGRIALTVVVALIGAISSRAWGRYLTRGSDPARVHKQRQKLVWAKNVIVLTCLVLVALIWASTIANFALSVAAVAGAMLIVSKELLMCGLGYGLISLSRPYNIGDFIEVGGYSGRVIDIDVFCTTVVETSAANQLTGKTISLPNSILLSHGVRNSSATGDYIIDLLPIIVPFDVDFVRAEAAAMEAANSITAPWQAAAEQHLRKMGDKAFLDLPSSRPKVLWESFDSRQHRLLVRFGCPIASRVTAEQQIFRRFWAIYQHEDDVAAAPKRLPIRDDD